MSINEIRDGEVVLARHIPASDAWRDGLNFFSPDEEYVQVGTWGYPAGKELLAHVHNRVERQALYTQEVLYVRKGRICATLYNLAGDRLEDVLVAEGDLLVLLRGGHGYRIVEDGTQVLEIKNGPYAGAELDRRRL